MTHRYVQEAAKLSPRRSDGSYPVVVITEGEGSTGIYSAELMNPGQAALFEGSPSFMNHPIDPTRPHMRDVLTIGGRVKNLHVGEDKGRAAILGDYFPRKEYAEFVEEYQDVIALSIFSLANGEPNDDGKIVVESFAAEDPYRSIDVVVAAGRGGRFVQANESLRTIESSLGTPEGTQPGVPSASGVKERTNMDEKILNAIEALTTALAPVISFVAEQKTVADAAVAAAEAKAETAEKATEGAIEAYSTAAKSVAEANLTPSQEADILAAAKSGKDVAPLIESAKKVIEELNAAGDTGGYVHESGATRKASDYIIKGGGR